LRNVLTAVGNSADPALADAAERLLGDASALVRGAAIWALGRLDGNRLRAAAAMRREADPAVEAEWAAALAEAL
jgi:epoxyqueuosine reductase